MVAFFLIFPCQIIYQLMVKSGLIPAFLGGYFTASALVTLPLVLIAGMFSAKLRLDPNQWLFGAFLILFGIAIGLGMQHGAPAETTGPHSAFLLKFICLYFLAAVLPWEKAPFQRACRLAVMLIVLIIFCNVYFFGNAFISTAHLDGMEVDYQGMAFAYLVMFMGALQGARRRHRAALYLMSLFALFHIGARAEFLALLVVVTAFEFFLTRSKPMFLLKALGLLVLAATLLLALQHDTSSNRILQLADIDTDQSFVERQQLQTDAIQTILDNPVQGRYASYVPGDYAHNVLSAWVDLGLLGFLLLNSMFLIALWGTYRHLGRPSLKGTWLAAFAMLLATYFLLISAKSYTYQLIPIALGCYVHLRACANANRLRLQQHENSLH